LIETIRAFGPGLEQAQVGVQTLFTIDARGVLDTNENVKVIVTSKKNFQKLKSNQKTKTFD